MILIAESGATKTEWCIRSADGDLRIKTQGISPYFHPTAAIVRILRDELIRQAVHLLPEKVKAVYYYGTGCTAELTINVVRDALHQVFPNASSNITYDLVASAHALCGKEKGIACILGTGSNSGYFNGETIERNIPGLGFILGDEGSGAYIGKMLAAEYLYGKLDATLAKAFEKQYNVDPDSLLQQVYGPGLTNRLLASFALFISSERGHPAIEKILRKGLEDFFTVHISAYEQCRTVPVHFSGSIAWHFRDVLDALCNQYGFSCGRIIREPMEGLMEYYQA